MDLSRVPGVTPEWKAALEQAGLRSTADLARASALEDVAQRTGIPFDRLEGLREAARHEVVTRFREAGAKSEAELVAADADALAGVTGLTRQDVLWFQAAAREASLPPRRVTLRPGNALARVRVEEDVHEGVPLRTLGDGIEPVAVLAAMEGNVVLLRPGQPSVVARLQGVVHDLPAFAESSRGEIAVRVADVRVAEPKEPVKLEKRGFFSRMRRRDG